MSREKAVSSIPYFPRFSLFPPLSLIIVKHNKLKQPTTHNNQQAYYHRRLQRTQRKEMVFVGFAKV
ncbi:hypothetical protein, partial [Pseudoalteromonas luteoviolacea]|uniref:hypothetical protein n=1 Tax=Pseudoalteromonas luteoviolacea TaxID=43657 RepID=UPI001C0FD490